MPLNLALKIPTELASRMIDALIKLKNFSASHFVPPIFLLPFLFLHSNSSGQNLFKIYSSSQSIYEQKSFLEVCDSKDLRQERRARIHRFKKKASKAKKTLVFYCSMYYCVCVILNKVINSRRRLGNGSRC